MATTNRRRRLLFGRWPRSFLRSSVRSFGQTKSASSHGAVVSLSHLCRQREEKQFNKQRNYENEGSKSTATVCEQQGTLEGC